ncbi:phosphoenolpyruvate carboxykinase [Clostridiaceae bacterium UIB06]|uniref:Phosphoenolpyruvate carboxykinase n=1 Tax=Clostridium thailandense TaxID=2794346 RepID=A0A949U0L3_9CLOT|nr:phosphoenolpyruvate carboxykinase [Clostridium thailandense]MBV7274243.1 phosphoenolpyruvate carboxykinase [Clostridium thailandense]MCH5138173.1 phosphoenolpyruvate carboxykinase [Clostridiaceae bacterium UIB06]
MYKEFYLNNEKAMINFTTKYCDTAEKLFNSNGFREVLKAYLNRIEKKESNIYKYIRFRKEESKVNLVEHIIKLFKILMMLNVDEINKINDQYRRMLEDKDMFIAFIEDFYGFWRKIERYTIVQNTKIIDGLQNVSFIEANNRFTQLILDIYRKVEESVLGYKPRVYRQLPVGGNAGLILNDVRWPYPKEYLCLDNIPFIQSILLDPPFIVYPKKNKRDGMFKECFDNPLKNKSINKDHWLCYPAKVGSLLAYIYFHRDYMAHGLSLCNLFEIASEEEYKDKKPDIVYVFGIRDDNDEIKTVFYDDKENDILLGYVNNNEKIDYFGYMKKMTLTLHNLIMIKRGYLPVHGAMVNIVNKNNKIANIVIVGDSGAGKSESLEAFRQLSDDYISDMNIIFDDMGVIKIDKSKVILGYGTEVGAFIRLDDLDTGYAFKQIDRSIFMNPDKINARLVIPVTVYKEIIKGYSINMFLYANNYEEGEDLEFINSVDEAIDIFKSGTRIAKGTTSEKGLVNTYFANPFGPAQRMEEMNKLLKTYFNEFFKAGIKVGQLRTRLGISGEEKEGPRRAALSLLKIIKNL